MISSDQLRAEELRLKYIELIERPDVFPTRLNWQYITAHRMHGLAAALYRKYLTALTIDDNDRADLHDIAIEEFPKFLSAIDREEAVEAVYGDISTDPEATRNLIRASNLFDAPSLSRLMDRGDTDFVFSVLDVYQPEYTTADLKTMGELLARIDNLPSRGRYERRHGVFGSSEKYICPDGHSNPVDTEYCRHNGCGKNARGLTEEQENAVTVFLGRLAALRSLLSQHYEME